MRPNAEEPKEILPVKKKNKKKQTSANSRVTNAREKNSKVY